MKKILILVVVMATMVLGGQAQEVQEQEKAQRPARVPAYRGIIERVQPNGDTLQTYLRGDERSHWMMMEDGWQIVETADKWYHYAKVNKKGEVVASRRRAHNEADRKRCEKQWLKRHGVKKKV